MSRCAQCKTDYPEHVLVCANDGQVLSGDIRAVQRGSLDDTMSLKAIAGDTIALPEAASTARPEGATVQLGTGGGSAPDRDLLPPGFKVGEYEVTSHAGSGGMASVYAGIQPVIGKQVAIKVLSRMLSADHSMVERFVQEARAVNQIRHHNIVDIFALGELPDGRAYCVMELLTGETLKDRIGRGSPSYEETVTILSQICEGLDAAHRANVVHRDLKPDNVFVVASNRGPLVKILDFGIAKLLDADPTAARQTRAGLLMGTPEYMSPEQCSGGDVDARTDIYLLGVMMYEVFTGRLPFTSKTPIMMINAHVSTPPTDPASYVDLPPRLRDLILTCLSKDPADRPQTALEVRDRLLEVVQELGVDVAGVPRVSDGKTSIRSTRTGVTNPSVAGTKSRVPRFIGAALVLALAGVGLIVVVKTLGRGDAPAKPVATPVADAPLVDAPNVALQIISDPPGATVRINGRLQALRSPYVFTVPWAETVAIRVDLDKHQPHEQTVTLANGELEKAVDVKLTPIAEAGSATGSATTTSTGSAAKPSRVKGQPSVISELQVNPSVAWTGEKTTITGTIKFEDPDGDVAAIRAEIKGSGKPAQTTPLLVAGAKTGTAAFTLVLTPSKVGGHSIEVWVQDASSNASNKLSATIEAMERDKPDGPDKPDKDGSASGEPGAE